MPRQRSADRPQHTVAVPRERWSRAGRVAQAAGTDRTSAINAFLAWYGHEDAAELPERPEFPPDGD